MDFVEKFKRLASGRNKSELSRAAGLPQTAFDAVVNKRREPLATSAIKMARVLGVSADWLFDNLTDWPPPQAGAASLGDFELVEELVRRQQLVIQDMNAIAARFAGPDKLHRLEALDARAYSGEFKDFTDRERSEYMAGIMDLERMRFLENRLVLMNPASFDVHIKAPSVDDLLADCPSLRRALQTLPASNEAAIMGHYAPGRITPVAIPDGEIIGRQQYIELGAILQRYFVPVIEDPENGAPDEKPLLIYRGQPLPGRFTAFARFRGGGPQSFAYQLRDDVAAPKYRKGSLVICEPGEPDEYGRKASLLVYEKGRKTGLCFVLDDGGWADFTGRPLKLKRGDRPLSYRVIGGPFPQPKDEEDRSDVENERAKTTDFP